MSMTNKELFAAEYKEVGDAIRHFSTTRSALTTFLLTVGLAAFGAYFHKQQSSPFFIAAGCTFLVASIAVCFRFSYLTERYRMYHKELWAAARAEDFATYPVGIRNYHPTFHEVWKKVRRDVMNWILVVVVCILGAGFIAAALFHDPSAGVPIAVCIVLVALLGSSIVLLRLRQLGAQSNLYVLLGIFWVPSITVLILVAYWHRTAAP